MSGSTAGIVVICVVAVLGIAIWLAIVHRSEQHPAWKNPKRERKRGLVQGGQHVGGGRSVMPTRDAPVPPGGGEPPTPEEEDAAQAGQPPPRSGGPMDL